MKTKKILLFLICLLTTVLLCAFGAQSVSDQSTTTAAKEAPVKRTEPIVVQSDLYGMWYGGTSSTSSDRSYYMYISRDGVYWMSSKSTPSASDFTSEFRISSSFSISVDEDGKTVCKFGSYSCTVQSESSLVFKGDTYHKK